MMNQKRGYAIDSYQAIEEGGARLRNAAPKHTSGVNTNWRSGGWRRTSLSSGSTGIIWPPKRKFKESINPEAGGTDTVTGDAGVNE